MAAAASSSEFELAQPPSDGVSNVTFSPSNNFLLVSSWDKTVRLYDVANNMLRANNMMPAPVLDCCFSDVVHGFSGGLDQTLRSIDYNTNQETVVGTHDAGIKCVEYASRGVVVTGGWDSQVRLWDPRTNACVTTQAQPDKVYTMSVAGDTLVVGTAGRHVWIWDLRNMDSVQQRRESSLKYQTRCIRSHPQATGYVLSSIEGRVAVEYFDPSPEAQSKKFAFKCHRVKEDGKDTIYPVNAIAFHPRYGTFATGGCDGIVNVWDGAARKRLYQYRKYPTSIASMSFNHDGTMLAIASSYTYEEGEKDHPLDTIFIRNVADAEVRPKNL